ncbi:MAG: iron-containing alcohol dehydrogenase, partial [Bacteroidales bacterium]|nr:iron-containing alcohol dehydrogenase [Bacteroidales bacterium]
MLGNFTFHNPTKLHFGEESLSRLREELKGYGPTVMLVYGGGSVKKFGILDKVIAEIVAAGKRIVELSGVMPNPTIEKVLEGAHLARREEVDLILGVGGGSTIDYCKAVAGSAWYDGDPWQYYFKDWQPMTCRWIPVGCVLTMAGTGSEMDSCSVISSHSENRKLFYNFRNPDFAILNPVFTFTVPKYQMVAGIYDIMSHILEQYLSGTDDNTSDYIAEGLMRSLIVSSRKALVNPEDYEARSNIMWTATWALNTLIDRGKSTDWMVHMLGQAVAAFTDATHGHTLAAVSGAYYRLLLEKSSDAVAKFRRLATVVWEVSPEGKSDAEIAMEGLLKMEGWMKELGL